MFQDRRDAGRKLAAALKDHHGEDCVVLALPRGGVPVAAEVARALEAPLDLVLARKIGAPAQAELAIGAVVDGETPIILRDEDLIRRTATGPDQFARLLARELETLAARRAVYGKDRKPLPVAGKTVILVDDGIATGNSIKAALKALRGRGPARIVVAVPVAPASALAALAPLADGIVCLETPPDFVAVGGYYRDFRPTEDEEVIRLLRESAGGG